MREQDGVIGVTKSERILIVSIILGMAMGVLIIMTAVILTDDCVYEMPCRTVGHLAVPCQ